MVINAYIARYTVYIKTCGYDVVWPECLNTALVGFDCKVVAYSGSYTLDHRVGLTNHLSMYSSFSVVRLSGLELPPHCC